MLYSIFLLTCFSVAEIVRYLEGAADEKKTLTNLWVVKILIEGMEKLRSS